MEESATRRKSDAAELGEWATAAPRPQELPRQKTERESKAERLASAVRDTLVW
eukprot:COSAG03_NODE_1530_length_3928_cov_5.534604_2_plen_53_part_00